MTGSMDMTKSVVHDSINTVMVSRIMQLVSSGVENALSTSEFLVDQYLLLTEEGQVKEAKKLQGFETFQKASFYIRLGSLSTKLSSCAYQQTLGKVKEAKQKIQETILSSNPLLI